ncbi:MAG TPA: helix-turn-helix transcriptional regulator [Polyangium sp.]|nr:helix-turn-helix transcriptional regulator [Polyangium sp.]
MARQRVVKSDFMAKIGARVLELRLERGFTLRKLADAADCSVDCIRQIEMGRSGFTTRILQNLAQGLGVKPFDILNHDTQTNDVGWLLEALRRDPESVGRVLDGFRGKKSRSSVPAGGTAHS